MDRRDLYALPLEEFTAQRNALAKELRQAKRREEAAEVAKLRKPTVPAWAVNQLVRDAETEMRELFAAGDALQRAQADLLSGTGQPDALRPAVDAEREAVDRLLDRAAALLPGEGAGARRQQIADTLHAAALDDDAREQVQAGCLERELQHVGLGGFGGLTEAPAGRSTPKRSASRSPAKGAKGAKGTKGAKGVKGAKDAKGAKGARSAAREPSATRRDAKADREREREAAAAARAARQAEADARRESDRAQRHLDVVQHRRDQLAEQLADLDGELEAAQRAVTEAAEAYERARR